MEEMQRVVIGIGMLKFVLSVVCRNNIGKKKERKNRQKF
jgi:hypothetical protein